MIEKMNKKGHMFEMFALIIFGIIICLLISLIYWVISGEFKIMINTDTIIGRVQIAMIFLLALLGLFIRE